MKPKSVVWSLELGISKTAEWVLSAMVFIIPLAFSWQLYDGFDLPKITILYVGVILLSGIWLFKRITKLSKCPITSSPIDFPVLTFVLFYGIALLNTWDIRISFWGQYRSYIFGWFPIFCGALLYWLTAQFYSKELEKKVIGAAIVSGGIAALYGLLQYFGIEFRQMPKNEGGRVWSSFGNPLYFGSYCMMAIPLAIGWLSVNSNQSSVNTGNRLPITVHRLLLFALCSLLFAGIILSLSRSAWVGLAAGLFIYSVISYRLAVVSKLKDGKVAAVQLPITDYRLLFFALSALLMAFLFYSPARQRFVSIFVPQGPDFARFEGWKQAGKIFLANPLLGTGPDTFVYAFRKHRSLEYIRATGSNVTHAHAHNDILQYATTSGILGLGAYLWLWSSIFTTGFRIQGLWKKAGSMVEGLGSNLNTAPYTLSPIPCSLIVLFVHNFFNFWTPATFTLFWIFLGLLAGGFANTEVHSSRSFNSLWVSRLVELKRRLLLGTAFILPFAGNLWFVLRPVVADYHFKKAQAYKLDKNYEKAVQEIEKAVAKNRGVATYYDHWSNIFKTLAQMDEAKDVRYLFLNNALAVTVEAVRMFPKNPDCQHNLGVALMWLTQMTGVDKRREAKAAFERSIEMDPNFVDAWASLAKVTHFFGDLEGEIKLWEKVLEIEPNHREAQKLLPPLLQKKGLGFR